MGVFVYTLGYIINNTGVNQIQLKFIFPPLYFNTICIISSK